ncbi:MAG: potassium channel family protein [Pseudohongiellaceae bacterium]
MQLTSSVHWIIMIPIVPGCILIVLVMLDIVRTTLTTKGEGLISSAVTQGFRQFASFAIRKGHKLSEATGAASILALVSVWLAGLWAGWVLIFVGLYDAINHSGYPAVELHDLVYFVGFTLSTLGVGDVTPNGASAQMVTVLASLNGLLVITLTVTYALAVVSGVVTRRVLAYKIHLAGGEEGDFLMKHTAVDDFAAWVADIRNELVTCTEQRLAYPVLDNFVSKEDSHSLAIQLARLGLTSLEVSRNGSVGEQSKRELKELLTVLYRYTALAGITDDDLEIRLRRLGRRDGWVADR